MKQERIGSLPRNNYYFYFLLRNKHTQKRGKDILKQKHTTNFTQKLWLIKPILATNSWTPNCHYPPFLFLFSCHDSWVPFAVK